MLLQARAEALRYQLIISPEPDVGYLGRTTELPMVMADGRTPARCAAAVIEATTAAIAFMLERGERLPTPASLEVRDRQLNVRLTSSERQRLESLAQRRGFRSVSDYLRAVGLRDVA